MDLHQTTCPSLHLLGPLAVGMITSTYVCKYNVYKKCRNIRFHLFQISPKFKSGRRYSRAPEDAAEIRPYNS